MRIALGARARCKITGLVGIVTSRMECLNGCWRYGVQPAIDKDGKAPDCYWIDEVSLEVIEQAIQHEEVKTGGPMTKAPRGF